MCRAEHEKVEVPKVWGVGSVRRLGKSSASVAECRAARLWVQGVSCGKPGAPTAGIGPEYETMTLSIWDSRGAVPPSKVDLGKNQLMVQRQAEAEPAPLWLQSGNLQLCSCWRRM